MAPPSTSTALDDMIKKINGRCGELQEDTASLT